MSPEQKPIPQSVVLVYVRFDVKYSARVVSMDKLGTRSVESDRNDDALSVYCYYKVGMRMIDQCSGNAMVQVGRKLNRVRCRSRNKEDRHENDRDQDHYDYDGRNCSLAPLSMHFF